MKGDCYHRNSFKFHFENENQQLIAAFILIFPRHQFKNTWQ
jgi:hypothetical protein